MYRRPTAAAAAAPATAATVSTAAAGSALLVSPTELLAQAAQQQQNPCAAHAHAAGLTATRNTTGFEVANLDIGHRIHYRPIQMT